MLSTPPVHQPVDTDLLLDAIHQKLLLHQNLFTKVGVKYGTMGLSLYHFARSAYRCEPSEAERGGELLSHTFELLNSDYVASHLFQEIADIGCAIEFLNATGIYSLDTNEILNDFDGLLLPHLKSAVAARDFDAIVGALSFGAYFLARLPSNPGLALHIAGLCDSLVDASRLSPEGRYWESKLMGDDSVYLGLSHGIAGICLFLMEAGRLLGRDYRPVVEESCRFIFHSERNDQPTFFPVVANKPNDSARYANNWCYGDPGTLYGLAVCARYTGNPELERHALELLRTCAFRERSDTYLIAGHSLLYGNAGLAMLYGHLARQTGEGFLKEAEQVIIRRILDAFDPEDEYLGLRGFWNQEIEITNYSFSEGLIGIALLLMSESQPVIRRLYQPFYLLWT